MRKTERICAYISILSIIGMTVGFYMDKKTLKECANKEKLFIRDRATLAAYEQWVETFQNRRRVADHLLENNYHDIAIYGFGRLGKQLYKDLLLSGINVTYLIDLNFVQGNKNYNRTPCFHPDEQLPDTDLIIITVPSEAKEIMAHLRKKVKCPVKSILDLLFVS